MSTADDQLASFVRRIESLDDEIKVLNDDKASVYQEAKGNGFNVKVLRKVIAARRKDAGERDEEDALFDLYWTSLHGVAHARVETQQQFEAGIEEIRQRAAPAIAGIDLEPIPPSVPEPAALDSYEAAAPSSDESAAPIQPETATQSTAARRDVLLASPLVPAQQEKGRKGGAAGTQAPPVDTTARKFRPHCLHPDRCSGYGQNHCFSCQQAIGAAAA